MNEKLNIYATIIVIHTLRTNIKVHIRYNITLDTGDTMSTAAVNISPMLKYVALMLTYFTAAADHAFCHTMN